MRWIVTAIALALFALGGSAWAQAAGTFFTDAKSRCKLWWPAKEPYYDDGKIAATWTILSVKWIGTCAKGIAQGRGTFEVVEKFLPEGSEPQITTFRGEGDFVDGKLSGRGFYVGTYDKSPGIRRVEGEFRDGVLNGRGFESYESSDSKSRFEVTFRDGKADGWGVRTSDYVYNGRRRWYRVEGDYRDGKLNGRGIRGQGQVGCKAEERYEGEFKDDRFHGRGTLTAYDGKVYTGVWQEFELGGKGLFDLSSTTLLDELCR